MKLNELINEISVDINKINIIVGNVAIYCIGELILKKIDKLDKVKGITYIEDPEYKYHYKNYSVLCNNLIDFLNLNNQNLLTITQSLEFIDKMLFVAKDKDILDNISIYTIKQEGNDNKEYFYRKLLGTKALQLRDDYGLELR